MGPRAGVEDIEKRKFLPLPGLELQLLGRPTRSQSLFRLPHLKTSKGRSLPNPFQLIFLK
jgi:hypothetical protein